MLRIFRHHISKIFLITVAGDLAVIIGTAVFAYGEAPFLGMGPFWPKVAGLAIATILLLYLADLYNIHIHLGSVELVLRLWLVVGIAAVLVAAMGYAVPVFRLGRSAFLVMTGLAGLELPIFRLTICHLGSYKRLQKQVLVLGSGLAPVITSYEGQYSTQPFKVLGFLDDAPDAYDNVPPGYDLLGKGKELLNVVEKLRPDILLIALANMRGAFPVDEILECRFRGVRVEDWSTFYEKLTGKIFLDTLRPSWLIFSDGAVQTSLTETVKRAFDVVLSAIGLTLAAPLMGLAAVCIKLDSPGPVIFKQERVGKDGKPFILYKLRSMREDAERMTGPVWAREHDDRVTRVGRILRKLRLDETPQMFNVLLGNMSFIGPRPERLAFVTQLKEQIPFYALRFSVKPGITGWAQVKYQYGSTFEDAVEKLQYELYYVKNMSLFLDLLILLSSIQVVLFRRGAR